MTYEYHCHPCSKSFDVVKSHRQMDEPEKCPHCETVAVRAFVPSRVHFIGTKVEHTEYNPGLGCLVKNSAHRAEIAKLKGVEEIGNEKPESIHKHFDQAREDKHAEGWAKADAGWVGDGT